MADGLGGAAIAGLQERQVAAGLTMPDDDVGAEGLGQLAGRQGPVPAEELGQLPGYRRPAVVIRVGTGGIGVERLGAACGEPLEGRPDGVRVAAEVFGDLERGSPVGRHQDHLQAVTDDGRQVGPSQGLEFRALRVS